jgi:hypothetical protein
LHATLAAGGALSFTIFDMRPVSQEDFEQSRFSLSFLLVSVTSYERRGFFRWQPFAKPNGARRIVHY